MTDKATLAALELDQEGLDKLEAEYNGKIYILKGALFDEEIPWAVIVRKPTGKEYKRFRAQLHNSAEVPVAGENLFKQIVVHPSPVKTDALLEEWPGIPEASTDLVLRLVGAKAQETGK